MCLVTFPKRDYKLIPTRKIKIQFDLLVILTRPDQVTCFDSAQDTNLSSNNRATNKYGSGGGAGDLIRSGLVSSLGLIPPVYELEIKLE